MKFGLTQAENMNIRIACCKAGTNDGWGEDRSLINHLGACEGREEELESFRQWFEGLPEGHEDRSDVDCVELYDEWRLLCTARRKAHKYLGRVLAIVEEKYHQEVKIEGQESFVEFLRRILK